MTATRGRPLRVLHVVATGQRRGGEIFASDLVGALPSHEVTQAVAVLRPWEGIHVPFSAPVLPLASSPTRGPLAHLDPRILRGLRRAIDLGRPDVVLAHGGEPLKYAVTATAARPVAVIYRRIGSVRGRTSLRGLRLAAYRLLMRRAARIVAVADAVRDETIEWFHVSPARIVTIPNAVDAERVLPVTARADVRRQLAIDPASPTVLSVGALTWEKDPMHQLDVAAEVLGARPGARFVLAGDGPLRATVEAGIRDRRLQGRTVVTGARADVPDLMAASDVLLMASRTEGMPGTLIEAGMAGLPAVACRIGGIPEVVEDGVTGLLVAADDMRGLAAAVLELMDDDQRRQAMGARARERCGSRFEIHEVAGRYLDLFREVANGR